MSPRSRYATFHRVEHGKIVETALFVDLLHLMMQAGQFPLPPQTGAHLVQPGPMTHDGLLNADAAPDEGAATLALINRMIGDINTHEKYQTRQEELAQCWHDDMIWWGPAGIGATYTIDRYIEQHQTPFRSQIKLPFDPRSKTANSMAISAASPREISAVFSAGLT
ncbi:hypothetical protein [Litoreibacter janthinus]|uniref:hypothetical protein n=1 Tax=Litoreibacter janthinus TaxID=670154 RepID=UPI000AFBAA6D|nr:hypothetical protein [Litoreibacter janthinus]